MYLAKKYLKLCNNHLKNKADVNGENGDPIIHAARSSDIEIMKLLIASKANVEVKDQQPLKIAMAQRNIEMCRLLLDAGACFETYYELDKILSNTITEGNVEFVNLKIIAAIIFVNIDTLFGRRRMRTTEIGPLL